METKPCRHCRQPIAGDARRCQHCHGYQSWFADHRDPRYWIAAPIVVFAFVGAFVYMMRAVVEPSEDRGETPKLTVSDVSSRIVPAPEGPRLFVLGNVRNASPRDGAKIWFRVSIHDDRDALVDAFIAESYGLIAPANGTASFRVVAPTTVASLDRMRVDVAVDRARSRTKWD